MVRKYFLALAVMGALFVIATSSAQAGWGHSYESSQPGESMSSEPATPQGSWGTSEKPKEGMDSSAYQKEEPVETGKLPQSTLESNEPAAVVNEFGGVRFRQGIDDGP